MNVLRIFFCLLLTLVWVNLEAMEAIYGEEQVPEYTLPALLEFGNGEPVDSGESWFERRRPELIQLFENHIYGRVPPPAIPMGVLQRGRYDDAMGGKATMLDLVLVFDGEHGEHRVDFLVLIPRQAEKPVPCFLGMNFFGNHTIHEDPRIPLHQSWSRNREAYGITENRATEASRGAAAGRWPVETILSSGYALATLYCGDIDPDFDDGFQNGVHALWYPDGEDKPADNEWGTLASWAWGLSRALDALDKLAEVDAARTAVIGHSRLGKAALWAGAVDPRFAMVISNSSGCGGAALSRRRIGERLIHINTRFPHWFNDVFPSYNEREDTLPVDQHQLLACIAPRPLYVASATEDRWADPAGEFASLAAASAVYEFLGKPGLPGEAMPVPDLAIMGTLGYHLRTGEHDITKEDWVNYLEFANLHLKR